MILNPKTTYFPVLGVNISQTCRALMPLIASAMLSCKTFATRWPAVDYYNRRIKDNKPNVGYLNVIKLSVNQTIHKEVIII